MDPIYETVSFLEVFNRYRELRTAGSSAGDFCHDDIAVFSRLADRWIRRGWEWYPWPALMDCQKRHYRPDWDGSVDYSALLGTGVIAHVSDSLTSPAYGAGAEVWYDDGTVRGYFAANPAPNTPGADESPAEYPSKWTKMTRFDKWIPYRAKGETPIGTVFRVFGRDPQWRRGDRYIDRVECGRDHVRYELEARGIVLADDTGDEVWVRFRLPCPSFSGKAYNPAQAYAAGTTVYYSADAPGFEGDYWSPVVAVEAASNPQANPLDWRRHGVPSILADFAARGAIDVSLRGDGQDERGAGEEADAWTWLYDERDKIQNRDGHVRRVRLVGRRG